MGSEWLPIESAPKGGGAELVTDPAWVEPPEPKIMGEEVEESLLLRLRGRADAAEAANSEGTPLVERFSLLREAASEIESLRASLTRVEEERDALHGALIQCREVAAQGLSEENDIARAWLRYIERDARAALEAYATRLSRATVTGANDEP